MLAVLGAHAAAPMADDWPTRPLTMVIGFAPGGSTDIQGRVLANVMEEYLGQPVNVVNQPGGGSAVAFTRLANNDRRRLHLPLRRHHGADLHADHHAGGIRDRRFRVSRRAGARPERHRHLGRTAVRDLRRDHRIRAREPDDLRPADAAGRGDHPRVAEEEGLDLAIVPTGGGGGMAPLVLGRRSTSPIRAAPTPSTRRPARWSSRPSCRPSAARSIRMCRR
jgi:hypothetical protein